MTELPKENTGMKKFTMDQIAEMAKKVDKDVNVRTIVVQFLINKLIEDTAELKKTLPMIESQLPAVYSQFLMPIRLGIEVLTDPKLSFAIPKCPDEIKIMRLIENKLARQTVEMRRAVSIMLFRAYKK